MAERNYNVDVSDNESTVQDFYYERIIIKILGGYIILTENRFLHLALITCVVLLLSYLTAMGVWTILYEAEDRATAVVVIQTMCLIFVTLTAPAIRQYKDMSLRRALESLKAGIYHYYDEGFDAEHMRIKKKRVGQVRFLSSIVTRIGYMCVVVNTLQLPLTQLFFLHEDSTDKKINPYLPIPIYMPFDTTNVFGYTVAFLSNSLFIMFFYSVIICHEETYLSLILQLTAQVEILNYSLDNIEKRAMERMKLTKRLCVCQDNKSEAFYNEDDFQDSFYDCLRANVQHHQEILRFTEEIKNYLEPINTLGIMVFSIVFASSIVPVIENPMVNFSLLMTLLAEVAGYLQICWLGQLITDKSMETVNYLYSTPWTRCRKKFNIILGIMITRSQKKIVLKSTGLNIESSLETYGDMITLAYKLMNVFIK